MRAGVLYIKNICPQCRLPSMSHDIEGKYFNFSRIMSKNANFQTLGPKGPQKPPNLHIIPNVGSINPIKYVLSPNRNPQNCIFSPTLGPKGPQKPSKLHIFSKSWQHISNKNIHPPNDGIIYPIFLTILTIFENFDNFAKLDFDEFFKIILPSKSRL